MATGWSPTTAAAIVTAAAGGTAFQITNHYVQLHSGDPGVAGTANVVNDGKRTLCGMAFSSGQTIANTAQETWTDWTGGGVPTHWSSWSAASGGTFQASGTANLTAPLLGGTLTVEVGALTMRQPAAA